MIQYFYFVTNRKFFFYTADAVQSVHCRFYILEIKLNEEIINLPLIHTFFQIRINNQTIEIIIQDSSIQKIIVEPKDLYNTTTLGLCQGIVMIDKQTTNTIIQTQVIHPYVGNFYSFTIKICPSQSLFFEN